MVYLLALVCSLLSEVDIRPQDRVANRTGIQCVWASLETIGRHLGITSLYDLTDLHKGRSGYGEICRVLEGKGLKFYSSAGGDVQDLWSLRNAIANDWPVAVGLGGVHMLVVVDVTATHVLIIDNSDPKRLVRQLTLRDFESRWDGWFVAIPPPAGCWHNVLWRE